METYSTNNNSSVVSDYDVFGQSIMVRGSEALKMLGLSRHNLERCVEYGYIRKIASNDVFLYDETDIQKFMNTKTYREMLNGIVDKRNTLNDLTGKEWIPETKSYMFGCLSSSCSNRKTTSSAILFSRYRKSCEVFH